jgi:hypothetical protein
VGLKLNGIHQRLVYADDVNLLGGNIDTIKKNTQTFIDACKEVCLEGNIEEKQNIFCYLVTRFQGKIMILRVVTDIPKMWRSSDTWGRL